MQNVNLPEVEPKPIGLKYSNNNLWNKPYMSDPLKNSIDPVKHINLNWRYNFKTINFWNYFVTYI